MMNEIKSQLEKFFGNCQVIDDKQYKVHIGPVSEGYESIFIFSDSNITVLNLIPNIDFETVDLIARKSFGENSSINYKVKDNSLTIKFSDFIGLDGLKNALRIIKNFFHVFITSFPKKSWLVLGEIQFNIFNETVSLLSSKYTHCMKTGWRGDIIAILRDDEWVISNIGKDHIDLPVLTITNGEIFSFTPTKDSRSLIPINLSGTVKKLRNLIDLIGIELIDLPRNEVELVKNIGIVLSFVDSINLLEPDKKFSILSMNINEDKLPKIKEIIKSIKDELEAIGRMHTFDAIVRKRIALRLATVFARESLSGRTGVIVSNVRKVSKLGAGKAIYIGKEELKAIPLGEKVLVSVIEEKGRRKIVIEPI